MISHGRLGMMLAVASMGMIAAPARDPDEEEREALKRAVERQAGRKRAAGPKVVREKPQPKVHAQSREIARRLRQEARKAAKAGA